MGAHRTLGTVAGRGFGGLQCVRAVACPPGDTAGGTLGRSGKGQGLVGASLGADGRSSVSGCRGHVGLPWQGWDTDKSWGEWGQLSKHCTSLLNRLPALRF